MNTEQERAAFEAWLGITPCGSAHDLAWEAWKARASLQSQDMKPVIEAIEAAQNNECGPRRPFGSSDPDSDDYDHGAFMWDYYQRAIDHARRVEGDGM